MHIIYLLLVAFNIAQINPNLFADFIQKNSLSICDQIIIILSLKQSFLSMSRNRQQPSAPQLTQLQKNHQSLQFGISFQKPINFTALYKQHFYSLYLLLLSSYADSHHHQQLIDKIEKVLKELEGKLLTHQNLCISGHLQVGCSQRKRIEKNKEALNYLKSDLLQKRSQLIFHSARNKEKIRSALVLVLSEGENGILLKPLMTLFDFSKTLAQFFGISSNFRELYAFQLIEFQSQVFKRRSVEVFVEIDKINSTYRYVRQKNNKALQLSITASLLNSSPFNFQMNISKQSNSSFYNILQYVQDQSYIEGEDISSENDEESFEQSVVAVPRDKNKGLQQKQSEGILYKQNEIPLKKNMSSQKVNSHYRDKSIMSMENSRRKKNSMTKSQKEGEVKSRSLCKIQESKGKILKMTDSQILSQEEQNNDKIDQNFNIKVNGHFQQQKTIELNEKKLEQLSSYVYNEFINEEMILDNKLSKMYSQNTKADTRMEESKSIFTMVESVIEEEKFYVNYNTEVRQVPNYKSRILKSLIQKCGPMAKELQSLFYNKKITKNDKEKYVKQFIANVLSKCNQEQIDQMIKQQMNERNLYGELKQTTMQESTLDIQNTFDEQLPIQESFYTKGNMQILKKSDTDHHLSIPNQNICNTTMKNSGIQFKKVPSLYKMNNKYRIKLEDSIYPGMQENQIDRLSPKAKNMQTIRKQ